MFAFKRISSSASILFLFCCTFFLTHELEAQAPEGVNYQAVARNNAGDPLANTTLPFVRFSIIATSTSGTVLYEEEHPMVSTNDFGLFNLVIGQGDRTGGSATNFAGIDWSSGNRFLRVAVNAGSGFENLGTTQLLSVPYALYAKTSGNASSNLRGGNGITIRNDSIINAGDLSETNELITSFSLETGNILRITEAGTNYDVDLKPILPTSTDDQNLSFNSTGDSIRIENGNAIYIGAILDDIANNAQRIIDVETRHVNDSAQTAQNQDSIKILAGLITAGSDDQNLRFRNDSIIIENGDGVDLSPIITDISDNAADIITNQNEIAVLITDLNGLETRHVNDSSQTAQNQDSIKILAGLIAAGSDDQNLRFRNDSILIENGDGVDLSPIITDITDNAADIVTNQNEIAGLITDLNGLETRHINDSAQTAQNQDSIAILNNLITSDNDADSTNELITGIGFVGRVLEINQQGGTVSLDFDTLFNSRRLNLSARITLNSTRITQNRDSIDAVVAIVNSLGDGGIYNGSGSLIGNTVVTQGANTLSFTSSASNAFSIDNTTFSVDASNNRVGIRTATPDSTLSINGGIKSTYFTLTNGAADGNVLTSDANGVASWQAPSGGVFERVSGVIRDTTSNYDSDFVIGSPQLGDDGIFIHENRMFFDKSKGAFRVGRAQMGQWDDANVGINSAIVGGIDNSASGQNSVIFGGANNDVSSNSSSILGGNSNTASAVQSSIIGGTSNITGGTGSGQTVLGGLRNYASGTSSTILGGNDNKAQGVRSSTIGGQFNIAQSNSEIVLGQYNDTLVSGFSRGNFSLNDRLLVIGNGFSAASRSNALVIMKSGNTGIGTSFPDSLLEVNGGAKVGALNINDAYTLPTTDGIGEQFLQTDGAGVVSWSSTLPSTNCPTGMTNVQGNICIEANERAASDWYDAVRTCSSLGYKLPTWAEWYGAATNAALTNETNNWEWVSDGTSNTARKVGNADLKNTANDDPETGSANFRCIFYK